MILVARFRLIVGVASLAACHGCARVSEPEPPVPTQPAMTPSATPRTRPRLTVPAVVTRRTHDPRAFTQGLLFADGALFESTGKA